MKKLAFLLIVCVFGLLGSLGGELGGSIGSAYAQDPALEGPTVAAEKAQAATVDRSVLEARLRLLQDKLEEVTGLLSNLQVQRNAIDNEMTRQINLRLKLQGAIETLADLVQ